MLRNLSVRFWLAQLSVMSDIRRQMFQSQLTYDRFMGNATESLSITGAVEAAGKVIVNTLLHRVDLLLI